MQAKIELDLVPFNVPNFVLVKEKPRKRQEGFAEGMKFRLADLDAATLDKLCEEFKKEIFKKAGKEPRGE